VPAKARQGRHHSAAVHGSVNSARGKHVSGSATTAFGKHVPRSLATVVPLEAMNDSNAKELAALDGAKGLAGSMLANGTSMHEVRKTLYSREALNLALGAVRTKLLKRGLCGVKRSSPICVGTWCRAEQWGGKG
jgi:hypothetical protein